MRERPLIRSREHNGRLRWNPHRWRTELHTLAGRRPLERMVGENPRTHRQIPEGRGVPRQSGNPLLERQIMPLRPPPRDIHGRCEHPPRPHRRHGLGRMG